MCSTAYMAVRQQSVGRFSKFYEYFSSALTSASALRAERHQALPCSCASTRVHTTGLIVHALPKPTGCAGARAASGQSRVRPLRPRAAPAGAGRAPPPGSRVAPLAAAASFPGAAPSRPAPRRCQRRASITGSARRGAHGRVGRLRPRRTSHFIPCCSQRPCASTSSQGCGRCWGGGAPRGAAC